VCMKACDCPSFVLGIRFVPGIKSFSMLVVASVLATPGLPCVVVVVCKCAWVCLCVCFWLRAFSLACSTF